MLAAAQIPLATIARARGGGGHFRFFWAVTAIKDDGVQIGGRVIVTEEHERARLRHDGLAAHAVAVPGLAPAPTVPPGMGSVLPAAAEYGIEILGPSGIPA